MISSIIYFAGLAVVFAGNLLIGWDLGRFFTEERRPLLDRKPFNCRPCFTFWVTFAIAWLSSAAFSRPWWVDLLAAGTLALTNFIILKTKYKIYE